MNIQCLGLLITTLFAISKCAGQNTGQQTTFCDTLFTESGPMCYSTLTDTRINYIKISTKPGELYVDSNIEMLTTQKRLSIRKRKGPFKTISLSSLYNMVGEKSMAPLNIYEGYFLKSNKKLFYVLTIFPSLGNCTHIPVRHVLCEISGTEIKVTPMPEMNNTFDPQMKDTDYPFYLNSKSDGSLDYFGFSLNAGSPNTYTVTVYHYIDGQFTKDNTHCLTLVQGANSFFYDVDVKHTKWY